MEDYYQVLGVSSDASQEVLKERFRFLAHAYHPDRFTNLTHKKSAEEAFKKINDAYQILSNPARRAQYDRQRSSSDSRHEEEQRRRAEAQAARRRAREEAEAAQRRAEAERRHTGEERRKREEDEATQRRAKEEQQRKEQVEVHSRKGGRRIIKGFLLLPADFVLFAIVAMAYLYKTHPWCSPFAIDKLPQLNFREVL